MSEDFTLGVDLGGTKVHVGLVDGAGRILASRFERTDAQQGPESVMGTVAALALDIFSETGIKARAAGVGVAGQVRVRDGVLRAGPNLPGWKEVPLAQLLESRLGIPTVIGNDLTFITLGEWRFGAGRGVDDLLVIFIGTGVGGGIVSAGELLLGADGYAGEIGHLCIVADGRRCHCGGQGCLEAYVSGWALADRALERCLAAPELCAGLSAAAGCPAEQITAASVGRAHAKGDPLAAALVQEAGFYLGAAVAGLANALNPRRIVLGGGVVDGIPELVTAAARSVRERALSAVRDQVEVVRSTLGSDAGVLGAAIRASMLPVADGLHQSV